MLVIGSVSMEVRDPDKTVRMFELRLKGYSDYRIAKELKISQITVSRILKRVEKDWPVIRKFVKDVEATRYFQSLYIELLKNAPRDRLVKGKEQLLMQGKPIAPSPNFSLPGYKVEDGEIKVNPETVPKAIRIFEAYLNGENMAQLLRELGLPVRDVTPIMRNPIYVGKILFRGKMYPFQHLAIIDKKLWEECQPLKVEFKRKSVGPTIFGFRCRAGRHVKDSGKAKIVERMFDLLFEGKNMSEIGREFGLNPVSVPRMLRNPKYAGKLWIEGKYVDAPFEAIVPFEKWSKAQKLIESRSENFSREKRKKLQISRRDGVLRLLMEKPEGVVFVSLKKATPYSKSTLGTYLLLLKREGLVEWKRQTTGTRAQGKWYITELGKQYLTKRKD